MGRTGRKGRILSSRTIFDYFEYSRFPALSDSSSTSCSALLEHTRIASITAESHIEPIKTKTKNYKGVLRRLVSLLATAVGMGEVRENYYSKKTATVGQNWEHFPPPIIFSVFDV